MAADGGPRTPAACDPERGHGLDLTRTLADEWESRRPGRPDGLGSLGLAEHVTLQKKKKKKNQ